MKNKNISARALKILSHYQSSLSFCLNAGYNWAGFTLKVNAFVMDTDWK